LTSPHDDLPPAFPEWLKRRIPLLRAEETNVLFQIFRRRRELYPPSGVARILDLLPACTVVCWAAMFLVVVLPHIGDQFSSADSSYYFFVLVAFQIIARRFNQIGARNDFALPTKVSEVFAIKRWRVLAARDLYLTGIQGRDVFEAVFLEAISVRWKAMVFVSLVYSCIPFLLIYPRNNFGNPLLFVVACVTALWAGYCFWRFTMAMLQGRIATNELEKRLNWWGDDLVEEKLISSATGWLGRLGVFFACLIGIIFLFGMAERFNSIITYPTLNGFNPGASMRVFLAENVHLANAIFATLEIGMACFAIEVLMRDPLDKSIMESFSKSDLTFKSQSRRVICEDTDGSRARLREK
jgi:hypothetical protein